MVPHGIMVEPGSIAWQSPKVYSCWPLKTYLAFPRQWIGIEIEPGGFQGTKFKMSVRVLLGFCLPVLGDLCFLGSKVSTSEDLRCWQQHERWTSNDIHKLQNVCLWICVHLMATCYTTNSGKIHDGTRIIDIWERWQMSIRCDEATMMKQKFNEYVLS